MNEVDNSSNIILKKINDLIMNRDYDLALKALFDEITKYPDNIELAQFIFKLIHHNELKSYWEPKYDKHKQYVGGLLKLSDFIELNKNNLGAKVFSILKHAEAELCLEYHDSQIAWSVAAKSVLAWPDNQDLLIFLIQLAEVGFCDDGFYLEKMEKLVESHEFPISVFEHVKEIVTIAENNI